jgi:hypothetical protein
MHLRGRGQALLAVAKDVGQPAEMEPQALVLVPEVGGQSGLGLLLVGPDLLALGLEALEGRSALGLAEYVGLNVALLALPLFFRLLALATQHAFEE